MWVERTVWHRVDDPRPAHLGEGEHLRTKVVGRSIRIIRVNGTLYALLDRCPHQGRSFEGGPCVDGFLVCPWHRIAFDPATGRARRGSVVNVERFPLEQRADGLYLGVERSGFRLFGIDLW